MNKMKFTYSALMFLIGASALSQVTVEDPQTEKQTVVTVGEILSTKVESEEVEMIEIDLQENGINIEDAKKVEVGFDETSKTIVVDGAPVNDDENKPVDQKLSDEQLFYIGARVGILVPIGIEGTILGLKDGKRNWNASVGFTTSYNMHTFEAGGGWHPRGRSFYVGGRLKDVILMDGSEGYGNLFNPVKSEHFFGISPEVGWIKFFGKSHRVMGTVALGMTKPIRTDYTLPLMPDFRFGIAVNIGKLKNSRTPQSVNAAAVNPLLDPMGWVVDTAISLYQYVEIAKHNLAKYREIAFKMQYVSSEKAKYSPSIKLKVLRALVSEARYRLELQRKLYPSIAKTADDALTPIEKIVSSRTVKKPLTPAQLKLIEVRSENAVKLIDMFISALDYL